MKNFIANILRIAPGNKVLYPIALGMWKRVITPIRRKQLQRVGVSILKDVHEVLCSQAVSYYVYWGTLLGIIREGNFIKHDDDIDFCIDPTNFDFEAIYPKLFERGFRFVHAIQTDTQVLQYTFSVHGIQVDFFCIIGRMDSCHIYSAETKILPGKEYIGFDTSWSSAVTFDEGGGQSINWVADKITHDMLYYST